MWYVRVFGILLLVGVLSACQATVQAPLELRQPEITLASLPQTDLRVGVYMPPSARRFTLNESWAQFQLGQKIETSTEDLFPRVFKSVKPLNEFPPPADRADDLDAVVTIDRPEGHFTTLSLLTHDMDLTAEFSLYTPDGHLITKLNPRSVAQITMGAMDPAENLRKAYDAADLIGKGVVIKFLNEMPLPTVMSAVADYKAQAAPQSRPQRTATVAPVAPKPPPAPSLFAEQPLNLTYRKSGPQPDDIAVIIGNANYGRQGKDIPDVKPAYADADSMRRYVRDALGVRPGNIIDLRDATGSQMVSLFGSATDHRGQLFDWVKPGVSRVFVYYAGHGAPSGNEGSAYMVPSDADAARIHLNGYPLAQLYRNLSQIPAKDVTVVLESCFSGASQGGAVISQASPIFIKTKATDVPKNLTVIAAGAPEQMASWEQDGSHGLFTEYYLKAMSGEADTGRYGNGDGQVSLKELEAYLHDTLTYLARRYYGRDQTAQIIVGR